MQGVIIRSLTNLIKFELDRESLNKANKEAEESIKKSGNKRQQKEDDIEKEIAMIRQRYQKKAYKSIEKMDNEVLRSKKRLVDLEQKFIEDSKRQKEKQDRADSIIANRKAKEEEKALKTKYANVIRNAQNEANIRFDMERNRPRQQVNSAIAEHARERNRILALRDLEIEANEARDRSERTTNAERERARRAEEAELNRVNRARRASEAETNRNRRAEVAEANRAFHDIARRQREFSNSLLDMRWALYGAFMTITVPIGILLKTFVQAGLEADKIINKFNTTFKDTTNPMSQFAKSFASGVGGSTLEAQGSLATYGSFMKGKQKSDGGRYTQKEVNDFAKRALKVQYGITALQGASAEIAAQGVMSALSGSTEYVDKWGMDIKEANMNIISEQKGFGKNFSALNESIKSELRLYALEQNLIFTGAIDAQGNLLKRFAGMVVQMGSLWKELKATMGQSVQGFLMPIIEFFNRTMQMFIQLPAGIKATTMAIGALVASLPLLGLSLAGIVWTLQKLNGIPALIRSAVVQLRGIAMFESVFAGMTTKQVALTMITRTGLIGAVVAAIAGLGWLVWEDVSVGKRGGKSVTKEISQRYGSKDNSYSASAGFFMVKDSFTEFGNVLKRFSNIFRGLIEANSKLIAHELVYSLVDLTKGIVQLIIGVISALYDIRGDIAREAGTIFLNWFKSILYSVNSDLIPSVIKSIRENVGGFLQGKYGTGGQTTNNTITQTQYNNGTPVTPRSTNQFFNNSLSTLIFRG